MVTNLFKTEPEDQQSATLSTATSPMVAVVIPVFNGSTTIGNLTEQLIAANPGFPLQIVLVNDCSADDSAGACRRLARKYRNFVTFVDLARNVGEHNAVMAGLAHAKGDYVAIMDDDFQNPPEEVFKLVDTAINDDRDIVFSSYSSKKHHWARNLASSIVNGAARKLMDLPDGLYLSSFKCLNRFTVDRILEYRGPFPYIDGLALRATRNIGVRATTHSRSRRGRSSYTLTKLINLAFAMLVNFSPTPLRLGSVFGALLSLSGLGMAAYVVHEKFANPSLPVGWASLAVITLVLSGIQLLMLGVIGEYLGQLVLTANGTPQYVVRSVSGAFTGDNEG